MFQGRYKAVMVEKDSYLLELSRYVVLNPIRAHMVNDASDWPWSNYRATMNQVTPLICLEVDWLLSRFGSNKERACLHYRNFVRAGIGLPPIWDQLQRFQFRIVNFKTRLHD